MAFEDLFNNDDFFKKLKPKECMEMQMIIQGEDFGKAVICRTDEHTIQAKFKAGEGDVMKAIIKKRPMTNDDTFK